jgi:hypothetical protein
VAGIIFRDADVLAEQALRLLQSEVITDFKVPVNVLSSYDKAKVIIRLERNLVWY